LKNYVSSSEISYQGFPVQKGEDEDLGDPDGDRDYEFDKQMRYDDE